jgi:hypothetical protein
VHESGLPAGELVYQHSSQGMPLTERELILWLNDHKVLFATGSAVTSLRTKYEVQIGSILDSLRAVGGK